MHPSTAEQLASIRVREAIELARARGRAGESARRAKGRAPLRARLWRNSNRGAGPKQALYGVPVALTAFEDISCPQ